MAGLFFQVLNEAFEGIASTSFGFRQPSCRVYNDTVETVNAYDMFRDATRDGKPIAADGRTTLIFVKQGTQWKIVAATSRTCLVRPEGAKRACAPQEVCHEHE
jgi:hypothetical protein